MKFDQSDNRSLQGSTASTSSDLVSTARKSLLLYGRRKPLHTGTKLKPDIHRCYIIILLVTCSAESV